MIKQESTIIEIEEKFRIPKDKEDELRKRVLELNWEQCPTSEQRDIYMDNPSQTAMEQRICVRIREEVGSAIFTYKGPSSNVDTSHSAKLEHNIGIHPENANALQTILNALGCKTLAVVEKSRDEWMHNITEEDDEKLTIAIDSIKGVGVFLEIEFTKKSQIDKLHAVKEHAKQEIAQLKKSLYITDEWIEHRPYRDIVMSQ